MTHLYRHYSGSGELLYVGVSLSAITRLAQHAGHSGWYAEISRVTIHQYESRELALRAERQAIIDETPKYNIQHKRDAKAAERLARMAEEEAVQAATDQAKARKQLVARMVQFRPVYSMELAAQTLSISRSALLRLVEAGRIGYMVMPHGTKQRVYFSGWHLIDYIESVDAKNNTWQPKVSTPSLRERADRHEH